MDLLKDYIAIPSITNTAKEKVAEDWIYITLKNIAYFKDNPHLVGRSPLLNDSLGREVIWSLYLNPKSKGKTLIFVNHHDVVSVEEYGADQEYAFDPEKLGQIFSNRTIPKEAKDDLDSGEWIFGRGMADMKAGGIIQLQALEETCQQELPINILYLSVPDEENLSAGMRHSQYLMENLENKYNLSYILCIDAEPYTSNENGDVVYNDSSAGKVMLNVFIQGVKSHIGEVLTGFNPLIILSKIIAKTERNLDLCDESQFSLAPPPTWSMARDFKERYDASIPQRAGGLYCQVTVSKSADEIINRFHKLCRQVVEEEIKLYGRDYQNFYKKEKSLEMDTMFYEDLLRMARNKGEDELNNRIEKLKNKYKNQLDNGDLSTPEFNFFLIGELLEILDYDAPCIVLAFSPPYYPFAPDILPEKWKRAIQITGEKVYGKKVTNGHYFMGISDLSYVSSQESLEESKIVEKNIPLWGESYSIPFELLTSRSIPVCNIGPWGKDLHKRVERVYKPHIEGQVKDHYLAFIRELINLEK